MGHNRNEVRPLIFSPGGQRMDFVAHGSGLVLVNEQEQKAYGWVEEGSVVFSPDSQRVAYVASVFALRWLFIGFRQSSMVVVDGQEGKHYDQVYNGASDETSSSLVFSPDSQRLASRFQF